MPANPIVPGFSHRPKGRLRLSIAALLFGSCIKVFATEVDDIGRMDLEQLMNVELETVTASKYSQKLSETASQVTIVGKDQIQQFGFRTLSDILRTVPGFFITNDRMYDYVGVRGFDQSTALNGRMLLMIDGNRINESIFDSGLLGSEFPLDVDLIDHVEIVRGPGSSLYGNNAFFAVVNVVTKDGGSFHGGELAGSYGSFDSYKGRFSYGRKQDNGLEYLISATGLNADGPTLHYPEHASPDNPEGITSHTNDEHNKQFFAKAGWGNFSFEGGYGRRYKGLPGGAFGTNFDDPSNSYQDSEAFVNLKYQKTLSPSLAFTGRAFYGDYDFRGFYHYGDTTSAAPVHTWWSGFEANFVSRHFDNHTLVGGIEAQENWLQQQGIFFDNPYTVFSFDERDSHRIGIYLQDDVVLTNQLKLSVGARLDDHSLLSNVLVSPRFGIVYNPLKDSTVKLQYAQAFRAPNVVHQYQAYPTTYNEDGTFRGAGRLPNTGLHAEQIETWELSWQQIFDHNWQFTVTGYYMDMSKRLEEIQQSPEFRQVANLDAEIGYGAEFELQRRWNNGALLRSSYSLIFAEDLDRGSDGYILSNVPGHLYQLNLMAPLFNPQWHGGFDMQMLSSRKSPQSKTPGYARIGLNLLYQPITNLDLSAGVYDLFDDNRLEPGGIYGIPQEGRTFRLKFQCRF